MCFVMTPMSYPEDVRTFISGRIREVVVPQGGTVRKGDVIAYLDEVEDFVPEAEETKTKIVHVEDAPYVSKPRAQKK